MSKMGGKRREKFAFFGSKMLKIYLRDIKINFIFIDATIYEVFGGQQEENSVFMTFCIFLFIVFLS
jgi:hypothetical protein